MPQRIGELKLLVDVALERAIKSLGPGCPERLRDAMAYSLLAPGKRLRPALACLAAEAVGVDAETVVDAACSLECIHCYSLIHDDLPAMDNDELRRGRPTSHVQFDEATAILAGDALQSFAFELLARHVDNPQVLQRALLCLTRAAGPENLVGGQMDDLLGEGRFVSDGEESTVPSDSFALSGDRSSTTKMSDEPAPSAGSPTQSHGVCDDEAKASYGVFVEQIHMRKTAAMIRASAEMGGILAGGTDNQVEQLGHYGNSLGLAFQIVDDCLDIDATAEQIGKTVGKDLASQKLTYPAIYGIEASRQRAAALVATAISSAGNISNSVKPLIDLANFVVERNH
jgi:geranylgeranyl diphosphate synthase type II